MVYLIHGSLISIRTTFGDCRELNMGCRPNTALYTPGRPNYGVKMMYHYRQIIGGYMTKKFNLSLFLIGSLLQTLTLKEGLSMKLHKFPCGVNMNPPPAPHSFGKSLLSQVLSPPRPPQQKCMDLSIS